jgi:hypothetical protein
MYHALRCTVSCCAALAQRSKSELITHCCDNIQGLALPSAGVKDFYARMLGVDVLGPTASSTTTTDITAANTTATGSSTGLVNAALTAAQPQYGQRTDRVEDRVARLLCERLRAARIADEMFRAISSFKALVVRCEA